MMRYLAIATLIVVGFVVLVSQLPHGPGSGSPSHFSSGSASPGVGSDQANLRSPGPVTGEAPWAFSALPECFRQDSRRDGVSAFARIGFPAAARPVAPGTRLRVADCDIVVGAGTVAVSRGDNRLVVPPRTRLYAFAGHLVLDRTALGREEVRIYEFAGPIATGHP